MNKYNVNQLVVVRGEWCKILSYRTGIVNGRIEYLVANEGKQGWVSHEEIQEVKEW